MDLMDLMDHAELLPLVTRAGHAAAALAVVLLIAAAGRAAARGLRQPEVIGEITAGLLAGPAVIALIGRDGFDALLPRPVFDILRFVATAGLILFLVGLAHHLATGEGRPARRATAWVTAGALVPPLLSGVLLAGWILAGDDAAARGGAPLPAFLLMTAVAMSITAVPVMARILADRGMTSSAPGRLALNAAIAIDSVGWLLLTIAISLGAGDAAGTLHSVRALLAGACCALAIRRLLLTRAARVLCVRRPGATAVLLGGAAMAVAFGMEHMGMTAILGAAMTGLAIPGGADAPWGGAVERVSRFGRALAPAFFVVTGVTVLSEAFGSAPWALIVLAVVLGCAGKGLGGYLGARLGGQPPGVALRVGVLVNARGLTELIALQAGHEAGILSAPLVLALVVMALATTALTGPLLNVLDVLDRRQSRRIAPDTRRDAVPIPLTTRQKASESGAR
ncbi:cation:proton antiporter domain-containing protein [Streptomyces sp. 6N223]|uniref:cation:proton antiporter domain-containing protein n=1 Tax=Streptomyces sp. 6N223 TaxID=3457412 RepID=UPI003FD2ACE8